MTELTTVTVEVETPYDVVIGHGVSRSAVSLLASDTRQLAVLHAPAVADRARAIAAEAENAGIRVLVVEVPDAEAAKTVEVAAHCWAQLGAASFSRSDAVIGVGGGATTDLSGFVAATWLRGVQHIVVPTTLLGMVDAAVGGKTGINTAEGKNLVGVFHSPAGVVCDLDALVTLPTADYAAGLAEVVKCGFISDPHILDLVEADLTMASRAGGAAEAELITRAVRVKAEVVARDFREATTVAVDGIAPSPRGLPRVTGREVLNYGHTFGHAIEHVEGYRWRHGDAISVGMVFVAELSRAAGLLSDDAVARHRDVLAGLGLPVSYPVAQREALLAAMGRDKKSRGSLLRFVVLENVSTSDAQAVPVLLAGPDARVLDEAFARTCG
ncbi:MAG: 3-dehydroquinate synthase [Actinobacteria bacterium]|uniref:3-dehydroquinate synthase n=1 Tax=freshwater metagenome TaxID=449393 RepID=A0A6J7PYK1_9ZZZZ|nr:3-dehydroquinate synthase [Actinomycetota bacterium]